MMIFAYLILFVAVCAAMVAIVLLIIASNISSNKPAKRITPEEELAYLGFSKRQEDIERMNNKK